MAPSDYPQSSTAAKLGGYLLLLPLLPFLLGGWLLAGIGRLLRGGKPSRTNDLDRPIQHDPGSL